MLLFHLFYLIVNNDSLSFTFAIPTPLKQKIDCNHCCCQQESFKKSPIYKNFANEFHLNLQKFYQKNIKRFEFAYTT